MALTLVSTPLAAQSALDGGWVLPAGWGRVAVGFDYGHHDTLFGDGGTQPLGSGLLRPLTSETFAPLVDLEPDLNAFFAATGGGVTADAESLNAGTPDISATRDARWIPFGLAVGVLPRVEIGVSMSIHRSELRVRRFDLAAGTVGINPDPDGNAQAFAAAGAEFEELGRSGLLPIAGTPLGDSLVSRVEANGGGTLALPDSALSAAALQAILGNEFGLDSIGSRLTPWRPGDLEANVRVLLLSNIGAHPYPPEPTSFGYRTSASFGVRLPTGTVSADSGLFVAPDVAGLSGWSVGAGADVFVGRRVWATVGVEYSSLAAANVVRRLAPAGSPLAVLADPEMVSWTPPTEVRVNAAARYRLREEIAMGIEYEMVDIGASTYSGAGGSDASGLDTGSGRLTAIGGTIRYTTLPAFIAGNTPVPAEFELGYRTNLGGPDGFPDASMVTLQARIYRQFWGSAFRR
jgi:hypothetical protein